MSASLVAVDYSRPIQPLLQQAPRIATIHSVFHRAVNIALDDTMLALLSSELPCMPNSVRLSSIASERLLGSLHAGMEVLIGNASLSIPTRDFSLHLPQTPPWEPRPDITAYRWSRETVTRHIRLLAHYLADQPQQGGLAPLIRPLLLGQPAPETPLSRMALPALRMLALASWRQDSAGVAEATGRLAGLGPGLTPSGDDALAGFAAVMVLLSPQLSAGIISRDVIAATIAKVARPRTTALSAVLLAHAAQGEIAEHMGKLLLTLALPAEASTAVLHAAERVLSFGAYSGSDT
ncbi:MAG TPA: DUF2877 domain-containing protein, partial [Ktedonobacteraceae bacterium]|nr:DUF2877 domain-containing protein [Ktedonobacteraceae bacterium]